jgi:hypothetical protein
MVVAILKEEWHHQTFKHTRLQDLPGTAVRHPTDDVLKLLLSKNGVEFHRELLDSDRAFVRVSASGSRGGDLLTDFVVVFRDMTEIAILVHRSGGGILLLLSGLFDPMLRKHGRDAA